MEETRVSRCFLLSYKFKSRCALNANEQTWTAIFTSKRRLWWRSTVELRQHNTEMLASTNRFWILLLFASLHYITACDKKILCNYERGAFISFIVKLAVIKLRGGFKPHFCHTRPCVPILDLSKQCDSLALQLRISGTAPTSIGPLQDTWHLICIFA